jgi:hypothetical protein
VIGELIGEAVSQPPRVAGRVDEVNAGDFRLLAAVQREGRRLESRAAGNDAGAVALVKPFGLHAHRAVGRFAALYACEKHAHGIAVRRGGAGLGVHLVAALRRSQVGESGAGEIQMGRVGMIDGGQPREIGVVVSRDQAAEIETLGTETRMHRLLQ